MVQEDLFGFLEVGPYHVIGGDGKGYCCWGPNLDYL